MLFQQTLFTIDDIADSFDYKNKYAIIEYLKDISLHGGFTQILLSHNFDFFRTVCSRLDMEREQKLHTIKSNDEIKFVIGDREDYDWAKEIISEYNLIDNFTVLFATVFGVIEPAKLVNWILNDQLNVRFQLQIHKFIWEPEKRGV